MGNLYERVGGDSGITRAVDALYERVLADPSLAPFFANVSMDTLKEHQRLFLVHILGGPAPAAPGRIREAHPRYRITMGDFYAVSDHMVDALFHIGVEEETILEIMTVIEPLSRQIATTTESSL